MDAITGTFHVDVKLIIAQLINFAITLVLVYFVLGKPLIKMMHKRDSYIKGGVANAQEAEELIKKTKEEYDMTLANAKSEANNIFQEGKKQAEAKKTEMIEAAKAEVASMIAQGQKSLEAEKQKILEDAKAEIVNLVVASTNKILKEQGASSVSPETIGKIKSV